MGPKEVNCEECGEQFPSKAKMTAHVANQHTVRRTTRASMKMDSTPPKISSTKKGPAKAVAKKNSTPPKAEAKKSLEMPKEDVPVKPQIVIKVEPPDDDDYSESEDLDDQEEDSLLESSPKENRDENCADVEKRLRRRCDDCNKVFKLRSSLNRHRKVFHSEGPAFSCEVCGKRWADKGTLDRHMHVHTGVKPFQCNVCQRQFGRQFHLLRHTKQSNCGGTPIFNHMCQECGKMFSRSDGLRDHLKVHAGEKVRKKNHACDICQKKYSSPAILKMHKRVHTGERPYRCDECGKHFMVPSALKLHGRVHTGERPFECQQCGSRFALSCTLKRHYRTHRKPDEHTVIGSTIESVQPPILQPVDSPADAPELF